MRGEIHLRSIAGDAAGRAALASGGGGVRALASDGSRLVAGDEDGRIRIWRAVALRGRRLALALSVLGSHDGPLVSCYELPEASPFEIDPEDSDGDDGDLGDALAIDYAGEPADPFAPVLVAKLDARADPASKCADAYAVDLDGDLLVAGRRADGTLAVALGRRRAGAPLAGALRHERQRRVDARAAPAGRRRACRGRQRDPPAPRRRRARRRRPWPRRARWGPTTTAGVAENCEGCGTSISWTGGWQSACPVCGPSAVVNAACALSPDGAAVLGRLRPGPHARAAAAADGGRAALKVAFARPGCLEWLCESSSANDAMASFDHGGIQQALNEAMAGSPEYETEPGFGPEQSCRRWVRGPGCWVRDEPELLEPCKTILEGGTEVQCVADSNDEYDGVERVKIFKPCDGWVARGMISHMPKWIEGVKFVVLVGAVGEKAIQFLDKNCPTFHALDPSATWGAMSHRISFHWKIATLGKHAEGDKIPADAKVYKKLNAFMAEFVSATAGNAGGSLGGSRQASTVRVPLASPRSAYSVVVTT
ncbi:hypothetical protein SO694_00020119 [Aureococcus anophagefferens]|uniref:Uncharacterized protein n=1 Tax=Aureococcus anophagefferens TaxID=44056 RepID=A0ABR1FTW2_AURAN